MRQLGKLTAGQVAQLTQSIPEAYVDPKDLAEFLEGRPVLKPEFRPDQLLNKGRYQQDNDIKPGTDAWFRLWFARQYITGEKPHEDK
jgi:hypothetical protein